MVNVVYMAGPKIPAADHLILPSRLWSQPGLGLTTSWVILGKLLFLLSLCFLIFKMQITVFSWKGSYEKLYIHIYVYECMYECIY